MKTNKFFDAMGELDARYVEEAAEYKSPRKSIIKLAATAACVGLVIFGAVRTFAPAAEPPMLKIAESMGSMGFEGYWVYDISELVNANPWTADAKLDTLPVYKNPLKFDEHMQIMGGDGETMREILISTAKTLGISADELTIICEPNEAAPISVSGRTDGFIISVSSERSVTVEFSPAISLPKEYSFTYESTYDELYKAAEYLADRYSAFINTKNTAIDISGGDRNIHTVQKYSMKLYDDEGSLADRIISYNLKSRRFACDSEGKLWLIGTAEHVQLEKVGDYPIISATEAEALFFEKRFITNVPYDLPAEPEIAKVELLYRTGEFGEYSMPYYRFLIEVPEEVRDGMKTYGAYYVPAVKAEYIENMPLWDGSFN